ncbi:MAG: GntR family transcriptional regulator [Pseudomonadota bacterium]
MTADKSSGETAYDQLIAAVQSGAYTPGARLREQEVGARFGLSRTPVREALRRLESEGIVEHRPRLGAVLRSLDHGELVELYEMRMVLERAAATMAAQHGAEAEFDALANINNQIARTWETPAQGAALNRDFHDGLYRAARNRFLCEAARNLNNTLLLLGPTTYADPGRLDVVLSEHSAIIKTLRARDGGAAAAAADAHLRTSLAYRLQRAPE